MLLIIIHGTGSSKAVIINDYIVPDLFHTSSWVKSELCSCGNLDGLGNTTAHELEASPFHHHPAPVEMVSHEEAVGGGPPPHHDPVHADICDGEVPQQNQNLRISHYFKIWAYRLRLVTL